MIYVGKVLSIEDNTGGDNIYTYIGYIDNNEDLNSEKKTFPLLPKHIQNKPKEGENVLVLVINSSDGNQIPIQRFYIGPIISQKQYLEGQTGDTVLSTTNLGTRNNKRDIKYTPYTKGCFGDEDEVALYGRGNTDVILGYDNLKIRCGSRLTAYDSYGSTFKFNTVDPAFIHMKYYSAPIKVEKRIWDDANKTISKKSEYIDSVTTIAGQEINIVSTNDFSTELTSGRTEMITDDNMKKIIENCHPIPYGDKLVEAINILRNAINNHVHGWGPSMASDHPTDAMNRMNEMSLNDILSEHIRIG